MDAAPHIRPKANIPRVELPAADWPDEALLATDATLLEQDAYVYLFLLFVISPNENIPIVLFPAAEPKEEHTQDPATPVAVLEQQE